MWFPDRDVNTTQGTQKAEHMVKHGYYFDAIEEAMTYCTNYTVAIDGGANVGFWAQKMCEKFSAVHAFEIDPETFNCLQLNCPQALAHNAGLSNEVTFTTIADGWNGKSMGAHLKASVDNNQLEGRSKSSNRRNNVKIPTTTIDTLNLGSLGFVKLDVEGHEAQVLQGAEQTLLKYKPIVMIEYKPLLNKRYGKADPALILEGMGASLIDKIGKRNVEWIFGWE